MTTIEQRFQTNQQTLAYLRGKENIQASIKENPEYWKDLAIEEEVLRALLMSRTRKVKSTLDRGFNVFAFVLFAFVTICALSLFNFQSFSSFTLEQKLSEIAMQFGLITLSSLSFFMCLHHFKANA